MNAKCISKARKWLVGAIVSTSSTCVNCASSLYTSNVRAACERMQLFGERGYTRVEYLCFGTRNRANAASTLSEFYGPQYMYVVSFTFFLMWFVPCAAAQEMQTMLIARFFDGVAGSAFLSVARGTAGDRFSRDELQAPMMIFAASPFVGPPIDPLGDDFINQFTSWRWTFYVLLIWAPVMLVLIALFVPESHHPVLPRRKAMKLRKATGDERWHAPINMMGRSILQTTIRSCCRPFILLMLEPMCLIHASSQQYCLAFYICGSEPLITSCSRIIIMVSSNSKWD